MGKKAKFPPACKGLHETGVKNTDFLETHEKGWKISRGRAVAFFKNIAKKQNESTKLHNSSLPHSIRLFTCDFTGAVSRLINSSTLENCRLSTDAMHENEDKQDDESKTVRSLWPRIIHFFNRGNHSPRGK